MRAAESPARSHVGAEFGLFTPTFFQDPYPVYERLRDEHPVLRLGDGLFMLTRYADCSQILRQRYRSREIEGRRPAAARLIGRRQLIAPIAKHSLIFTDDPEHGQTRRLMHQGFTAARINELGTRVPGVVAALIARRASSGTVDVIGDLAVPLVTTVMAELLGIPREQRALFRQHGGALTRLTEPLSDLRVTADAARGAREMQRVFTDLVVARRETPEDDLISAFAHAESAGEVLTTEQIVANCILLLNASEVTIGLIGNATLTLLRHPDHLARFRTDAAIRANALEELMRYDAPTPFVNRIAGGHDALGDSELVAGDTVALALCAANRDPRQFDDPDELDFDRADARHHLSFAQGIHYCLGSALARAIAIPALLALLELPGLRPAAGEPRFRHQITFRCAETLPIAFETGS